MNNTSNPIAMQSKEAIRKALIKAMNETPYEEITIKQLLAEAGVTRRTFYRNFDNKEDVLYNCLDDIASAFITLFSNPKYFSSPKHLCDAFTEIIEDYKDILYVLTTNGMESLLFYRVDSQVLSNSALISEDKSAATKSSIENYRQIYRIGGTLNVLFAWVFGGQNEPLYQIIESLL